MNADLSKHETAERILNTAKSIAVVGFSSRTSRAGYYVPMYLQENGYRIIPVNPYIDSGLGEDAYPDLTSIPFPVDLVLLFRRSEQVLEPGEKATELGAKAVWMQLGISNEEIVKTAEPFAALDKNVACSDFIPNGREQGAFPSSLADFAIFLHQRSQFLGNKSQRSIIW